MGDHAQCNKRLNPRLNSIAKLIRPAYVRVAAKTWRHFGMCTYNTYTGSTNQCTIPDRKKR
eukprot:5152372-Amphidinium_carterae.2